MIHLAVLIPIQGFENIRYSLLKIRLEFIPVNQIITIRVHISEMGIKGCRLRQGCLVTLRSILRRQFWQQFIIKTKIIYQQRRV